MDYNFTYRNNAFHLASRSSSVCSFARLNNVKKDIRHRMYGIVMMSHLEI